MPFILSISFVYSKFDYKNFSLSFSQELKYPFFATNYKEGNFYVIDNSKTRVIVFDKDKTVSSILNGGSRELNNFFYASWVHKGSDGFIYIINIVNSLNRYSVEKEEILRFYPDGRFNRVIFQKIYDQSDAPVRWGRLFNIHEINNEICVFYIYPDGIERLRIHKESGVVQKETILLGHLSGFPVKSIDFDAKYGFVYLTNKGEIRLFC